MDFSHLSIEEFTSPAPVIVHPATRIDDAFALMQRARVRHLPVQEGGQTVGVISDRDLRPFLNRNWSICLTVKDVMQESVLSVPLDIPIGDAAFIMAKNKVGSLLVVDCLGELCGIFTTTDALNALVEMTSPDAGRELRAKLSELEETNF